jgi:hypothetical protein
VKWTGISVGQGILEVGEPREYQGRTVYPVSARTRANKFIQAIYPVDDRVESLVDAVGTFPWRFDKQLREGKYYKDEYIEFDQERRRAVYYKRSKKDVDFEQRQVVEPIPAGVQDPLSLLLFCRHLPWGPGQRFNVVVHTDKRDWDTLIRVAGEESIKTDAGRFDCWLLKPEFDYEGVFHKESNPTLWIDQARKIVVRVEVDVTLGFIRAELEELSGV